MLLGIDVGGTFTDAVILQGETIVAQAKVATNHEDIVQCLLAALDKVLVQGEELAQQLERVVISSTIVTNALVEHKLDAAFLAVITGPGRNVDDCFPVKPLYLKGYVDHRGQVTAPLAMLDGSEVHFAHVGTKDETAAVSGKFAVRNSQLEQAAVRALQRAGYAKVFGGSALSGELNFVRRTNSAYFAAQVYTLFLQFATQIEQALRERNIMAPIHILKADGGTLPLQAALDEPIESVFTGPAASVLGIQALVERAQLGTSSISLDVGGTTTDIAFWQDGLPLLAKRGAIIDGYPIAVRAFHMRSVAIGGDSRIHAHADGSFTVGPERAGSAAALGGGEPTLSDALIVCGLVDFGDKQKSQAALERFLPTNLGYGIAAKNMASIQGRIKCSINTMQVRQIAHKIVAAATSTIQTVIEEMLVEWAKQPVYTVEDVIRGTEFVPQLLIGVGGGAPGLIKALGSTLHLPVIIPQGAFVANAIGAAVARPTLRASLRADTTEGYYVIPEGGVREDLPNRFTKTTAEQILRDWLLAKAQEQNYEIADHETETIDYEHFRTIHGYYDQGDIYSLRMQLKPGILHSVQGKEEELL